MSLSTNAFSPSLAAPPQPTIPILVILPNFNGLSLGDGVGRGFAMFVPLIMRHVWTRYPFIIERLYQWACVYLRNIAQVIKLGMLCNKTKSVLSFLTQVHGAVQIDRKKADKGDVAEAYCQLVRFEV